MHQEGKKEEENVSLTRFNLQSVESEDSIKRGKKYSFESIT